MCKKGGKRSRVSLLNKIPQTNILNSRHLFFTVLEAGQSEIRCQYVWLLPGEGSLPGLQTDIFLLCAHMAEKGSYGISSSSHKGTDLIMGACPHDLV